MHRLPNSNNYFCWIVIIIKFITVTRLLVNLICLLFLWHTSLHYCHSFVKQSIYRITLRQMQSATEALIINYDVLPPIRIWTVAKLTDNQQTSPHQIEVLNPYFTGNSNHQHSSITSAFPFVDIKFVHFPLIHQLYA